MYESVKVSFVWFLDASVPTTAKDGDECDECGSTAIEGINIQTL
jgi:hypothetical protein